MRQMRLRDPAPSRVAYRFHRLWLTPLFRRALRFGLPMALTFSAVAIWFNDETRRETFYASLAEIQRSIEERPEFMVTNMDINGPSDEVDEDIREIVSIDFPISSFDLDLEDMRTRIEELDAVAQAQVRIRPGGLLQIDIKERLPSIVWRNADAVELLDKTGRRVAALTHRSERFDLPLIVGDGADKAVPEALDLLAVAGPIRFDIRGLSRVGERRWDVVLRGGGLIQLPEVDPLPALEHVIALHRTEEILNRDIEVIDFRNPIRPTVRISDRAIEQLNLMRKASLGGE